MVAYINNKQLKRENNTKGLNHWEAYIEEMLHELGADFEPLDIDKIPEEGLLGRYSCVIIGAQSGQHLDAVMLQALTNFTENGGLLIAFMAKELDELFGIETINVEKEKNPYEISGYFDLLPHPLTRNVHPHTFLEQKLLILSDTTRVRCTQAEKISCLYSSALEDTLFSAISWREVGKGYAAYFAFDAPKTVWALHQGRPLYTEKQTQVNPRPADGVVLGSNSGKVPYADEILYLLQNMIAQMGEAFVYTLPPHNDKVPDAAIIWGGDEYFGPTHWSMYASDFMRSLGLPYHINIESENHPITKDEFDHITKDNGHEISLYILLDEQNKISPERIKQQRDRLVERFGVEPGCCLFNVVRWYGWAEPARWLVEGGGTSVHSKLPGLMNIMHPLANAPAFAMVAGTANPFHYYDCAEYANAFIPCVELPAVGYELGHNGSVGVMFEVSKDGAEHLDTDTAVYSPGDNTSINFDDVHLPVDMAVKYHTLSHFFYHPTYIKECPNSRAAIQHIVDYIGFLQADIYHMANNQAAAWWNERRGAKVRKAQKSENIDQLEAIGGHDSGLIAKMPVDKKINTVTIDGKTAQYRIIQDFGKDWLHIVFPPGGGICEIDYVGGK